MSASLKPDPTAVSAHSHWFSGQVHAHERSLRSYLQGSFPKVRDIDDVVQESYLRIWKARPHSSIVCARAFLFRVARNVALSLLRRERQAPFVEVKDILALPATDNVTSAAEAVCLNEELLLLAQAIDSLPSRCREIMILRRIERLSYKEIAGRLGIAEETVGVQVARGVKRCGAYLRRHGLSAGS